MTAWAQREFTTIAELRGPLLVVSGVDGVGWDEFATIRMGTGETRHGLVLEADRDLAVVQVLEGTGGMRPTATRVAFSGSPLRIPVGTGWLGRVCNGRGEPIDGGPPVTGEVSMPVAGFPINPALREPPAEPVLTGISVIDALTTLVRGQKLPVFSVAGLPHLELAAQLAAQASAGGDPFCVVFAAMGLTHADAATVRAVLQERSATGELVFLLNLADAPVIERILTPRLGGTGRAAPPRADDGTERAPRRLLSRPRRPVSKLGYTVPPGRAGRLWLTRRLQVARRGADLLDGKLRILTEELGRLHQAAAQTAEEWNRSCIEAERWLLRASVLGGQRAVRLAAGGEVADVTISYTVSMGVRHPAGTACVVPAPDTWDGPTLTRTRQVHAAALAAAVRHAAAAEALRVVEAEALATRYRLRAIRDRWIPRLEQALAEVTLAIEEQELADAARLRLASGPALRSK